MKRKIFFYLNLTLLFIVSISCVHEQYRSIDTGEEKVVVTFNPTNILTTGTETQINKFRMIAFNSGGTLEFNKKQSEMDNPSKDLYKLKLRPGMYTLYGIGNEPDELLTQLDEVRTSDALDVIKLGDVRSIPENNIPLIWKRTIYIRATGLEASVGQVSLTNSPDDSGWSSTLDMQMERIAAKISISARKGNPNEEINMTRVEIKQIPVYTTITPSVYPAGELFYSNNFEWGSPKLITGDADSYTELVKGQIVAENLPVTEARKTMISIEYTRNGIAESAVIPFEGNVDRNKWYQYKIKITGIKVEIENITVLQWNETNTDITIPGVEINFSQVEVPYSLGQESKVFFTTKNIHPDNLSLSTGLYDSNDGTTLIGYLYDYFDVSTKYTYSYDPVTRIGSGELTIRRKKASLDKHRINIYASGLTRSILVNTLGVAGSNIYWDSTRNQLAFEDTPKDGEQATHEKYQGVPFGWGALQAYSGGWSRYGSSIRNPIIWSSTGDTRRDATTILHSATLEEGNKFKFDPDLGIGDICLYMTRRGWTPPGKKWRMPRKSELNSIPCIQEGTYDATADPNMPTDGTGNVESGLRINKYFLPHSGYFHRSGISYNFNSKVNSTSFYGIQDDLKGGNYRTVFYRLSEGRIDNSGVNTNYGNFIRCVVDDTPETVTPLYVVSYDLSGGEAGTVTAPTPEGIILNQHVDAGGTVILSDIKLTSSRGLFHRGWSIDGKEYPLGGTISNIQKNYVAKPVWGYSRTLALKADGTLGFWEFADGTNLNVLYFKWGSIIGTRIPDAAYETIKQSINTYYHKNWISFNPSDLATDFSDYENDLPTTIPSGQYPDITVENIKNGLGDPCRLVGYTADQIKSYISRNQLPPDNGWRMPEVRLNDPKNGMPSASYYTTVAETGYPGVWLAMEKDGINTVYKEFLPAVSRITIINRQGGTWNYPYSNYLTKTVDNVQAPEFFRYKYQWIHNTIGGNPQSWIGMHDESHLIRCVPNK